ncbi:calcium-binding protein [Celeribacter sp. ULVN23_4]
MAVIENISTHHVDLETYFSHISDIEVVTLDGRVFVLTVGQYDSAAQAWELQSGSLVQTDSLSLSTGVTAGAEGDLLLLSTDTQDYIFTGGGASGAFKLVQADGTNVYGSTASLGTAFSGDLYGTQAVQLDTGDILVLGALADQAQIGMVEIDAASGTITNTSTLSYDSNAANDAIGAAVITEVGAHTYYVAALQNSNELRVWDIDRATGALTARATLADTDLFWGTTPSAMASMDVAGTRYLAVGAYTSSSIHMIRIDDDGTLSMVDQVVSDSISHVGNVTALATVAFEGETYMAVGGNQGGLALYLVLHDGTLSFMSHIYDNADMALQNISDIDLYADAEGIDIFVSSSSEYGLTHLYVDMTNEAGLISGTASSETLTGTSLNDIFYDGAGSDVLQGGAGADVFVFAEDGESDTISDFKLGTDRIDLSHWSGLNGLDQLGFITISSGIRIHYGSEVLTVYSDDGYDLFAADFSYEDLFSLDRVDLISAENQAAGQLLGTVGNDVLHGTSDADFIYADDGNDSVYSYEGDDEINSGAGDDFVDAGAGDDIVSGEDGADEIYGGEGRDTIDGGPGDDILDGGRERDVITGGDGDDTIYGFTSHDRLYGELGNDKLYGSNGSDYMKGGEGSDYLAGGRDADSLFGGPGNDQLRGGSEDDALRGEAGNDMLFGQDGTDRFIFSDDFGRDTIYDFDLAAGELIDLSDVSEITSWSDLVANHLTETAGGSAQIYVDADNIITLSGIAAADLDADFFVF